MSKLHIGVIGTGSISHSHLSSYANNTNVVIYAVCDVNEQRVKSAAYKYGAVKSYTHYTELLADPNIDAVSICTWNHSHAEISIAAVKAGKHVLVEKPLCLSVEEALKVQVAVRASGKILMVGFVRRYDANAQLLHSFIQNDEFGELYYAKASNLRRLGNPGGWFADVDRSGGGPLIDLGVHLIDLCWYMMGRPKAVTVSGNTYQKLGNRANIKNLSFYKAADYDASKNSVEDLANAIIRFDNGASLMIDVSFTLHQQKDENSAKIYGTKGSFQVDPNVSMVTEKHNTILNTFPQTDHTGFDFASAFQNEINHFVECVQLNKEPISPVEDGVEIMKILCAIYESAAKEKEVKL